MNPLFPPTPTRDRIIDLDERPAYQLSPSCDPTERTKKDECMAKLHNLLTKEPSENLMRAESRALAQKQYYQKANQIFTQMYNDGDDVFPFLALPAELRLAVYFELLVSDDRLVTTWRGPRKAHKQQKRMFIDILLTCRLCWSEGVGVLYGENVFDFEEICGRPNNFSKPFLKRIGSHNASLIRIVVGEYSAAAEELAQVKETRRPDQLTLSFVQDFLCSFNITLSNLRLFALSIIPYGFDAATMDLMNIQASTIMGTMHLRVQWLDNKNEKDRLDKVVDGICEREVGLMKADFWNNVDPWIGFHWTPPFVGREWVFYNGVRAREDAMEE